MAATTLPSGEPAPEDTSLYPIAVLIDELKNEDVQVCVLHTRPCSAPANATIEMQ